MGTFNVAKSLVKKLVDEGFVAYFAGGWVRDYLMGHPSSDIDIATDASPEEVTRLFEKTVQVGAAFGVVVVLIEGKPYEVTTFRRDVEYKDGRKPTRIESSTPEEDAIRRDFTINGMFYDPLNDHIIDYVGGREDIRRGLVRTIGNPYDRFFEDRLRMIRAVRFACRFRFHVDPETEKAIFQNSPTLFPAVSMERIAQELTKMAHGPQFAYAVEEMHRLNLLQTIFPDLAAVHLTDIKKRAEHFSQIPKTSPLLPYLIELFDEVDKAKIEELGSYLRLSKKEIDFTKFLHHVETLDNPDLYDWSRIYADERIDLILQILAAKYEEEEREGFFKEHEDRRRRLAPHIKRIRERAPLVTSQHLFELGYKPGKEMGSVLKEAEKASVLQDFVDVKQVIRHLKEERLLEDKE